MKPERLTIRGLATFTQETVIDFTDLGLFAIVGPTGSGKSSIIDALCFVLYGRVARLGGRTIEPLISVGAKDMAVSLTFSIRSTTYRATRRVKRTKQGASTDEAALERLTPSQQMLASTADELTEAIVELLGLTFDEFTKAVVLPQGEFANLLTATPKDRQNLLSSLLGTGLYELIRQQATTESRVASAMADQLRVQVHQVDGISEEDLAQAREQVVTLTAAVGEIDRLYVQLEEARQAYAKANQEADVQKGLLGALDQIGPPPQDLVLHGERLDALSTILASSQAAYTQAQSNLEMLGNPPETKEAQAALTLHSQTEDLVQAHIAAQKEADLWLPEMEEAKARLAPAEEAVHRARISIETLRREYAAVEAVADLGEGDSCPVCASILTANAPALVMEPDRQAIHKAQAAYDKAVSTVAAVKLAITNTTEYRQRDLAKAERAHHALQAHETALASVLPKAKAQAIIDQAAQYQTQWKAKQAAVITAKRDVETHERALKAEQQTGEQFIHTLDQLRLGVAALNPPKLDSSNAIASWEALATWASTQRPTLHQAVQAAEGLRTQRLEEGKQLRTQVEDLLIQAHVPAGDEEPPVRVNTALTKARIQVEQLEAQLKQVAGWKADIAAQEERSAVHAAVAKHLGARAFPTWLLHETTVMLVAGASKHLTTLSDGQYRLAMDGNDIVVIDRANANLTRSVRTLSGGETFLASLALALALADYIHQVAASPVAIESLFIDEGFGSLDGAALDQAAQALEQLGATDRMVGVITHVSELAERLPVRIRVQRNPSTSKVTMDC